MVSSSHKVGVPHNGIKIGDHAEVGPPDETYPIPM
jgi:hypothetical protein